jgi:hypothetical protein
MSSSSFYLFLLPHFSSLLSPGIGSAGGRREAARARRLWRGQPREPWRQTLAAVRPASREGGAANLVEGGAASLAHERPWPTRAQGHAEPRWRTWAAAAPTLGVEALGGPCGGGWVLAQIFFFSLLLPRFLMYCSCRS